MTKSVQGNSPAVTPFGVGDVAKGMSEEALRRLEGDIGGNVPITLPPGNGRPATTTTRSSRPSEGALLQSEPPPPPNESGDPSQVKNFTSTIGFAMSFDSNDPIGTVWACMLAMQKMMSKEAMEDRKLYRGEKKLELEMKAEKLDLESKKIGEMKVEAGERYDAAMTAANLDLAMGIASIGLAVVGAIAGAGTTSQVTGIIDQVQKTTLTRISAHYKAFGDYQKSQGLESDKTQLEINAQQKRIDKQTNAMEEAKDSADARKDMRTRGLDNLQKLLDIIRSMNYTI